LVCYTDRDGPEERGAFPAQADLALTIGALAQQDVRLTRSLDGAEIRRARLALYQA